MKYIMLFLFILSLVLFPQENKVPGAAANNHLGINDVIQNKNSITDIVPSDSEKEDTNVITNTATVQCQLTTNTITVDAKPSKTEDAPQTQTSKPSTSAPINESVEEKQNQLSPVTQPIHSHTWNPIIKEVYHDEVGHYETVLIKESWEEEVPLYDEVLRDICSGCGKDITNNHLEHIKEAMKNGNMSCSGHHSELITVQVGTEIVVHEAEYETVWVIDQAAYTEELVTGYKCNCGHIK